MNPDPFLVFIFLILLFLLFHSHSFPTIFFTLYPLDIPQRVFVHLPLMPSYNFPSFVRHES